MAPTATLFDSLDRTTRGPAGSSPSGAEHRHLRWSPAYWRLRSVFGMMILLSDPRVLAVPVADNGDPLERLPLTLGPDAWARAGLGRRLEHAASLLSDGLALKVVEGHRTVSAQAAIVASYTAQLRKQNPTTDERELSRLSSRFVAPLAVAPHVAGAAVDLTLIDAAGHELDMGTPIDATPEQSDGACFFAAKNIEPQARAHRSLLAKVLTASGLVNYPTEWWHWSYGDRYWAIVTGASHALYGPVLRDAAA